jgi:hypothetical protein
MKRYAWVVFVLAAVAAFHGCATTVIRDEGGKGAVSPASVSLRPTLTSSERYAAYRQEVDSWGWPKIFLITCKDLAADAADIVSLEVSFGAGILVDVQPTKILEVGVGYADVGKVGWRDRAAGYYHEIRKEGGLSGVYYRHMDLEPVYGTSDLFHKRARTMRDFALRHNSDRHWADIGGQVHLAVMGGSAYVSPKQAVDFVVAVVSFPYNALIRPVGNLFGFRPPEIDPADDDTVAQVRRKYGVVLVREVEEFEPAETIDELFRVGY